MIDIITVYYNEQTAALSTALNQRLVIVEPHGANVLKMRRWRFLGVDNRAENRGFAKACNLGVQIGKATSEPTDILGFLNPDVIIDGPFIDQVERAFADDEQLMITGERFGKSWAILERWGLDDWVCGAAFFVRRPWFEKLGGFDEQYVWSWEETDFIRRTQEAGLLTKSINLPIRHQSPWDDSLEVMMYKQFHLAKGYYIYMDRWMR
jgi:hypothetical protein